MLVRLTCCVPASRIMGFVGGLILLTTLMTTPLTQGAIQYSSKTTTTSLANAMVKRSNSYTSEKTAARLPSGDGKSAMIRNTCPQPGLCGSHMF